MRVAVTGATGRLGRALVGRARRCAVHRTGRTDRVGPRGLRPRRARRRRRPPSIATAPRSSSTPRPGPMSTAAPATRTSRCAAERHRDRRPRRGLRRRAASTSWSCPPTRSSTGRATDGVGVRRPTTSRRRSIRTAPPSSPASARRPRRTPAAAGGRLGIVADGVAVRARPSRTSRARSSAAATGPRPPGEPCASSPTNGARRPTARDVAEAIVRAARRGRASAASTTSSTAVSPRGPTWAARHRRHGSACTVRSSPSRPPPGHGRRSPPRWGVLAPTPLPSGEPLRPWPDAMADYAPTLERARPGGDRDEPRAAAVRRSPASATARSPRMPTRAARSASCGAPTPSARSRRRCGRGPATAPTFVQANLSTSAPGVLRGLHVHRRQLDYWVVPPAARSSPSWTCGPCLGGSARPAGRRDPRAGRRRLGGDPGRRRPRVPGARAARACCTSSRTRTTAPTSWASPGTTRPPRCPGRPPTDRRTGARSCPIATGPTRRWRDLVVRLRHGGPDRADPHRIPTPPHRPRPYRPAPMGLRRGGTIPRLSGPRSPPA